MLVYLNGAFVPKAEAHLPVDDRGFLFGDGVYEVTRAVDGRLFEVERHLERLRNGAAALALPLTDAMVAELPAIWERLLAANGLTAGEAMVYLQVTRGAAPRTHQFPPAGTPPTVFASASALLPPDAVRARGAAIITQPDIRWARCEIKSVNLLPNVLAKQAAAEAGAFEAVFVREDGTVTEGAQTSAFAIIDGTLRTHPLTPRILPSVTRAVVLELARELGIPTSEEAFDRAAMLAADEVFVASTTADVMPVVRVDGMAIGDGAPGPRTRALADAIAARIGRAQAPATAGA
ncbi:aminotransferase class IV [Roseisolibacter agri]|uniref:Aminotransferase n=1 Tax=Roseisolibacter agri TaxID=2014610 RepID=A0AA37Q9Q5_9BACT|nr:aminotransferase class IV [Roseisolibacter agri]GLC25681.1 aminotransferase [Roseisolibacter agri]